MAGPKTTAELKDLARSLGRTFSSMFVLADSNDPWLAGNPARRERAEWFAELYDRLDIKPGAHLRRIHYIIISQPLPILKPNGEPYLNTLADFDALLDGGRDARYLGLLPALSLRFGAIQRPLSIL